MTILGLLFTNGGGGGDTGIVCFWFVAYFTYYDHAPVNTLFWDCEVPTFALLKTSWLLLDLILILCSNCLCMNSKRASSSSWSGPSVSHTKNAISMNRFVPCRKSILIFGKKVYVSLRKTKREDYLQQFITKNKSEKHKQVIYQSILRNPTGIFWCHLLIVESSRLTEENRVWLKLAMYGDDTNSCSSFPFTVSNYQMILKKKLIL